MNITEFKEVYKRFQSRDRITIQCDRPNCLRTESLNKDSAMGNIDRNGEFRCRQCSFTDEGKKRISAATSYKRSDEVKQKMSVSKKKMYQTEKGQEMRKHLSRAAANQHANMNIETTRRRGLFPSKKNNDFRVYGSSYELKAAILLEADDLVLSYQSQVYYEIEERARSMDLIIYYKDGRRLAVEIKAKARLHEESVVAQINDGRNYAKSQGYEFVVWTEQDLGFKSPHEATKWADEYISKMTSVDYVKIRRQRNAQKAVKHYHEKLKSQIQVYCSYCGEDHTLREEQYLDNIEKNGRYICIKENGAIVGSRSKVDRNPYHAEGKKKCSGECKLVLPLEDFSVSNKATGQRCSQCKKCRAARATKKYREKE